MLCVVWCAAYMATCYIPCYSFPFVSSAFRDWLLTLGRELLNGSGRGQVKLSPARGILHE